MRNPCKNRVNILNIKECNLSVFLLGIVWNPCVLRRVSFFAWEAMGKNSNYGSTRKKGLVFTEQVLLVQRRGGINKSNAPSLSPCSHALASYFFSFWCSVGDSIFNQGCHS